MKSFKALIEIKRTRRDRNKNRFKTKRERLRKNIDSQTRIMYIRGNSMVDACDVIRKVRYSRLKWVSQISSNDYFKGVSKVSDFY